MDNLPGTPGTAERTEGQPPPFVWPRLFDRHRVERWRAGTGIELRVAARARSAVRTMAQIARDRRLWLCIILLSAAGLQAWRLGQKNLWLDESVSWDTATGSVATLLHVTAADIHPPLYYLLLKGWTWLFGSSPTGLRSLSVVSSLIALGLMYRLSRRLLPFGIACAALCWYVLSPQALSYAQEARMYAPVAAAVLGACLAYRRWVDSAFESRSALAAYAVCATAALYLHYFTALVLVAIWLHVLLLSTGRYSCAGRVCRPRWADWLAAHMALALLYAPWAPTAFRQITRGQFWHAPVTAGQIPAHASNLARILMFGTWRVPDLGALPSVAMLSIVAVGLAHALIRAGSKRTEERGAFIVLVALAPPILGLAALPFTGELHLERYLAYATPLVILAAAYGLRTSGLRPAWVIVALVVAAITPFRSLADYYTSPVRDYDSRPIVSYLNEAAHHGTPDAQDVVLVAPGYVTYALWYLSRGALEYRRIWTPAELEQALQSDTSRQHIWIIVDYRWPGFDQLSRDPRLEAQDVRSSQETRVKLFRLRGIRAN